MVSIALNISDAFRKLINELPWINWSKLAREEILKEIQLTKEYEEYKKIVAKSKLTEEDALKLAREVNKSMHEKLKKLYWELS